MIMAASRNSSGESALKIAASPLSRRPLNEISTMWSTSSLSPSAVARARSAAELARISAASASSAPPAAVVASSRTARLSTRSCAVVRTSSLVRALSRLSSWYLALSADWPAGGSGSAGAVGAAVSRATASATAISSTTDSEMASACSWKGLSEPRRYSRRGRRPRLSGYLADYLRFRVPHPEV